ncbi:MAG: UDP-2,3-diacylglucosamine diphosphatase [Lacipirellulaceae bacterium]
MIRSLFISDVHLGCKHSQAADLAELLERVEPLNLYIVGDFIDGWKLKRRWRWDPQYDRLLQRILELKRGGTKVFYTPGNHDEFLRPFVANFGVVEICDRFVHRAADGRRYLVMHGDQFDRVEQNHQWLSLVASYAYDALLTANWWGNRLRGKQHDPYAFCGALKRRVKRLVSHVSEFESLLVKSAREASCDGIICGHVHAPRIVELQEVAYLNTGDWVENCTALVEKEDGAFELIRRDGRLIDRLPARPAPTKAIVEREPVGAV